MYTQNISNIINYLQQIKKNKSKFQNIINILIDLLQNNHIKEFLRRYDIFIQDLKKKSLN
tara:strand:- start:248 stop:427 length:180 start_codon:yes stop_codon:yes gene_type:complete